MFEFFTYNSFMLCISFALFIFIALVIFRLLSYTSFTFNIMLSLAIVPGHLPYFIITLPIKNYRILLLTTVPFCVCLPLSYIHTTGNFFINYLILHITSHNLLPLSIVPCHLPYFIRTLNFKMLDFYYIPHFPAVHVYLFP